MTNSSHSADTTALVVFRKGCRQCPTMAASGEPHTVNFLPPNGGVGGFSAAPPHFEDFLDDEWIPCLENLNDLQILEECSS